MKTGEPIIKDFRTKENFGYLWLKYVNGFNLNVHCAKCLLGEYSNYFKFGQHTTYLQDILLDEHPAKYYYLCGVTKPYRWRDNLHVAFEFAKGEKLEYWDGKTFLQIENARKIEIESRPIYRDIHGTERAFYTCRNWMFAYQMTHEP